MTFDLLLTYYDNPKSLHNWLARLLLQTDFLHFDRQNNIFIADTGTPLDRIPDTLAVLKHWSSYKKAIYVRTDMDEIRASAPSGTHARPGAYAYNLVARELSQADLLMYSCLGNVYVPGYFTQILDLHKADDRLFIQPKQLRLHSSTYHKWWFDQPLQRALTGGTIMPVGGMPDASVRREHVLAIGGWDEDYITWGMVDIDLCSRMTGQIELGVPAEQWYKEFTGKEREPFNNYGLKMLRPQTPRLFSLICNDYCDHLPDADSSRRNGLRLTMGMYLHRWGIIHRNLDPKPITYRLYDKY